MKCKKHPTDFSSDVGVCASCLRERLFGLIAAQVQAQARAQQAAAQAQLQAQDDHRKSDLNPPPPPPLVFPRSVSPYISRRKSENAASTWPQHRLPDQKFFSTPQVVSTGGGAAAAAVATRKKNYHGFSLLSRLFRSKSLKPGSGMDSDSRVPDSVESCTAPSASPPSSSWFSTILPGRRKEQMRTFSLDEFAIKEQRKTRRHRDRGMSPAMYSDEEDEHCHAGSSGYSSESSQGWRQTPRRTPAATRRSLHRNVSAIAFCLSPLVRASPNRHWNQKGVPPEAVVAASEIRLPAKPKLTAPASFCKNRSRKLADFGRFNRNH